MFERFGMGGSEVSQVLGKSRESAANQSFNLDFNTGNFDEFGGDVQSGKFVQVGKFVVPASTRYAWGYGSAGNPENQGYLYVDLQNATPAEVEGTIQFAQESPTGRQKVVVAEFDTTRLDSSRSDRTLQVPFPEQIDKPKVGQDSALTMYMDSNANETIDETESEVIIPVTEYDLSS